MMNSLFIGSVGMPEVLLIVLVVLLLFGGKKIPELMRGIGKGIHSFKEGDVYKRQLLWFLPMLMMRIL